MKELIVAADVKLPGELAGRVEQILQAHGGLFINGLSEEKEDIAYNAFRKQALGLDDTEIPPTPDEMLAQVEVMYVTDLTAERFRKMKGLKWMHTPFAGVNRLLAIPEVRQSEITLTNGSGVIAASVADQVMAFVLMFSRQMAVQFRAQQRSEWSYDQVRKTQPDELAGQTLGLVGYGRIGSEIGRRAKAFGMRVIATRQRLDQPAPELDQAFATDLLDELLAQSDFVVVTAPLTPQTTGLVGAAQFARMKPTAHIINIARGALIREAEMITALQEGQIAGAGLDVFETEPLPATSPLWQMPNVLITPHTAGLFKRLVPRSVEFFGQQLERYLAGQPLENVVSRERGY